MATSKELALLRAITDDDGERLDEMAQTLYETEHLDGCEGALAAAFQTAVRARFPEGHRLADVIRLVADTRIMAGPERDRVMPIAMECTVRAVLEDPTLGGLFGGGVARYTQLMVCRFLASSGQLGDPDAFLGQVHAMLGTPSPDTPSTETPSGEESSDHA